MTGYAQCIDCNHCLNSRRSIQRIYLKQFHPFIYLQWLPSDLLLRLRLLAALLGHYLIRQCSTVTLILPRRRRKGQAHPLEGTLSYTAHLLSRIKTSLTPTSADSLAPPSPYPQFIDPSPTESNGTDTTEIEEEAQEGTPTPDKAAESQARPMTEILPNHSAVTSPTSPSNVCDHAVFSFI